MGPGQVWDLRGGLTWLKMLGVRQIRVLGCGSILSVSILFDPPRLTVPVCQGTLFGFGPKSPTLYTP